MSDSKFIRLKDKEHKEHLLNISHIVVATSIGGVQVEFKMVNGDVFTGHFDYSKLISMLAPQQQGSV